VDRAVFLVTNVPTPYRIPLYNEVARQLKEKGLSLKALFGASGYARREWHLDWNSAEFEYEVLGGRVLHIGGHEYYLFTYPGLLRRIRDERPATVIVGGYSAATLLLRLFRPWTKTPFIIWSGEIRPRAAWREILRRWLVHGASGFIAYGSRAKQYLEALGAEPDRTTIAINTVDTAYFGAGYAARCRKTTAHVLVCTSGLVERKQIGLLVRIAAKLARKRNDFEILIVGNGPERAKLEALARDLNVSTIVRFAGFRQRDGVADALREASCFLFPTGFDIWGLVLVEAMAAGVPCIASVHAGATADLIEDGKTGYAVDFSDSDLVCARIEKLLDDPAHAAAIGAAAHDLVTRRASLAASARGFVQAVERVLASGMSREVGSPVG
jgi:glycosyltransferase involved in cell wall biosynthesis